MRRPALYSSSRPARATAASSGDAQPEAVAAAAPAPRRRRFALSPSSPALLWAAIVLLAIALASSMALRPTQRRLTQEDINAAVLKTMETQVMPSEYARAYENVRPAVVRVVSYIKKSRLREEDQKLLSKSTKPKPLGPDGKRRMYQEDVNRVQEFRKCIECFLCQDVCHVIRDRDRKDKFVGPRFMIRLAGLEMHPLDDEDRIP